MVDDLAYDVLVHELEMISGSYELNNLKCIKLED